MDVERWTENDVDVFGLGFVGEMVSDFCSKAVVPGGSDSQSAWEGVGWCSVCKSLGALAKPLTTLKSEMSHLPCASHSVRTVGQSQRWDSLVREPGSVPHVFTSKKSNLLGLCRGQRRHSDDDPTELTGVRVWRTASTSKVCAGFLTLAWPLAWPLGRSDVVISN